jgi:tol-pal system protein YbgF
MKKNITTFPRKARWFYPGALFLITYLAGCAGLDEFLGEETTYNYTQTSGGSGGSGGGQRGGMPDGNMVAQMRSSRMSSLNRTPGAVGGGMAGGGTAKSGGNATARSSRNKQPKEDTRQLQAGVEAYNIGDYKTAVKRFKQFLDLNTTSDSAPEALFFLGESYYRMKNYQKAMTSYKKIDSNYSLYPRAGEALYKAGKCLESLGNTTLAKRVFKKVAAKYPSFNKDNIKD